MSIAGLIMQQLSRNRFVSPTTAGTLDAARLGVLVSLMVFTAASPLEKILVSFVFALAGTFVFMKLLEMIKFKIRFHTLVGLMFGSIIESLTTFFAYSNDLIQNMTSWMQGEFSMIMSGNYEFLYLSIPTIIISLFICKQVYELQAWVKIFLST